MADTTMSATFFSKLNPPNSKPIKSAPLGDKPYYPTAVPSRTGLSGVTATNAPL